MAFLLRRIAQPMVQLSRPVRSISSQRENPKFLFEACDSNHDGVLQPSEVKALLQRQGCNLSDDQVQRVIQRFDRDGDGNISYNEFLSLLVPVEFEGGNEDEHEVGVDEKRHLASL
eukprot:Sspe_Gene.79085::Locus_49535_Transcript_1_1_Confidence_1.000_Length_592::g.79085::m.79085/K02183/CALM; calmodulin